MNNKRVIILLVMSILVVIVATVGVTFAYLSFEVRQTNPNTVATSCYDIDFQDSDVINITSYPMSSASAFSKIKPYKFNITNECEAKTQYQVILSVLNSTNIDLEKINYSLDGSSVMRLKNLQEISLPSGVSVSNSKTNYMLDFGELNGINATKDFNLHMWIDESAGNEVMGKVFAAQITVYSVAI